VKHLWVLRHAKSSWDDPALADHDRPLAPRGRKAGKRIARFAAEHDVRPDLVLCSTALRATATLELVRPALGTPEIRIESDLYHASPTSMLELLRNLDDGLVAVMLIGHNPGLHDLVGELAPPGPGAFPTAALAGVELEIGDWSELGPGCGRLAQFVLPREL